MKEGMKGEEREEKRILPPVKKKPFPAALRLYGLGWWLVVVEEVGKMANLDIRNRPYLSEDVGRGYVECLSAN